MLRSILGGEVYPIQPEFLARNQQRYCGGGDYAIKSRRFVLPRRKCMKAHPEYFGRCAMPHTL